ncbi:hypothetical protein [Desulfogranum japonicum]|uniref:hypothetical protein n=1 Tax=Desulfogranum japonicum TaxID=231447 RepID=UPI000490FFCF|nr:hypothetical protein [Desulfogranum japonicum]
MKNISSFLTARRQQLQNIPESALVLTSRLPTLNMTSADSCPIPLHVACTALPKQPQLVGQFSPDKNVIYHDATAAFMYLPNPRRCHVALTHMEIRPCMPFLFVVHNFGISYLASM